MRHPLYQFQFCPVCGAKAFVEHNEKAKKCMACGFVYYFNPSSAVACFIKNAKGELLLVRRGKEPAKGTLDLPGGFVDMEDDNYISGFYFQSNTFKHFIPVKCLSRGRRPLAGK